MNITVDIAKIKFLRAIESLVKIHDDFRPVAQAFVQVLDASYLDIECLRCTDWSTGEGWYIFRKTEAGLKHQLHAISFHDRKIEGFLLGQGGQHLEAQRLAVE